MPFQVQGRRCEGPTSVELCLDSGLILVPKGRKNDVRGALCSEFGAFRSGLVHRICLKKLRPERLLLRTEINQKNLKNKGEWW